MYLMVKHKHMYRYSIRPALAGLVEGGPHTWFPVLGYSNYILNFLSVDLLTGRKFQITGSAGYKQCYLLTLEANRRQSECGGVTPKACQASPRAGC